MRKLLLIIILWGLCPASVDAQWAAATNNLSLMGMGAKAIALNSAYSAVADDYSATFWNPAAIGFIHSVQVGGMHSQMSLDRELDYASIILPLSYFHSFGVSWASLKVGEIEERTGNTSEPDYIFNNLNRMLWLTYSMKFFRQLSIGANVKYLQSQLDGNHANGFGVDIGVMWKLIQNLSISFVAQDMGARLKWDTGKQESFNRIDKFGFGYKMFNLVVLSADVFRLDNKMKWTLGTEIKPLNLFKIRSGFNENKWTLGTGISLPLAHNKFLLINYALAADPFNVRASHELDFNLQLF